jgi:hypothetical protein
LLLISIVILGLMTALEVTAGSRMDRPISLDMSGGNPLVWLMILALCIFVVIFGRRLVRNGYRVRTIVLFIVVFGLILTAASDPVSKLTAIMLWSLFTLTILWFAIMALEYESSEIVYATASCFVALPVLGLYGVGFAERALILYSVAICNILYYRFMSRNGRTTW